MAAMSTFGSLPVPAPDDTMEMSSPANRNLDDDIIDIDFEDYGGDEHATDDDRMLEDGDTRPATATDEMMEDDALPGERTRLEEMHSQIDEEFMRDDLPARDDPHQQPEDEELIDYGEDEFQDEAVNASAQADSHHRAAGDEIGLVQIGEEASTVFEGVPAGIPGVTHQEAFPSETALPEEPTAAMEGSTTEETHWDDAGEHNGDRSPNHDLQDPEAEVVEAVSDHHSQEDEQEEQSHALPPIDTAVSTSGTGTPGTPTDTGLHPMNIRYGDMVFPLFRSKNQPEGLLKGDNLVQLSLADLIKHCRQRLALKIGEDISEDQELVLGFERLGLMLVEDCRASFQNSLHDVLQVYLQLYENDGATDVPPLSLSLTVQLKFASSFAILKEAAAGGQGMSTFNFLQTTTDDQEYGEDYGETGDLGPDGDFQHEGQEGQEHADVADAHHQGAEDDEDGQFQDQSNQDGEHDGQIYDEYYQSEEEGEHGEEHSYFPEEDGAAVRLDELEEGHKYDQGLLATGFDVPKVAADEVTVLKQKMQDSSTSSHAQEDSTYTKPEPDADESEEISTFLTEYEEEEAKNGLPDGDLNDTQDATTEAALPVPEADHLGAEDHLHDPTGQDYAEEYQAGEEHQEGDHETGEQTEEYNLDQADTYDEQYDENHPDYQPGEDEQYHTAQDLLGAEQYEHDPDQDQPGEEVDDLDDTVGTVIHHETAEYEDEEYQEEYPEQDGQHDLGDDIGLDFEDESYLQDGNDAEATAPLTAKRSFDELEEVDEEANREAKKARAS